MKKVLMVVLSLFVLAACASTGGDDVTLIEYKDGNLGITVEDLEAHIDSYLNKYADEGTEMIQTSKGTYTYIMKDGMKLTAKTEEDMVTDLIVRVHIPVAEEEFEDKTDLVNEVAKDIYEHSTMEKDFDEILDTLSDRSEDFDAEEITVAPEYMGEASSAFGSYVQDNVLFVQRYGSESVTDNYYDLAMMASEFENDTDFQENFESMQTDVQEED